MIMTARKPVGTDPQEPTTAPRGGLRRRRTEDPPEDLSEEPRVRKYPPIVGLLFAVLVSLAAWAAVVVAVVLASG